MARIQCQGYACDIELGALRLKSFLLEKMEPEITPCQQVDHQIHVVRVMESVFNIDNELRVWVRLVNSSQEFQLLHNTFDAVLVHHSGFEHFFHRKFFTCALYNMHFAEPATTDGLSGFKSFDRELF